MRTLVTHSLKAKCFDADIHFVGLHALYDLGSEVKKLQNCHVFALFLPRHWRGVQPATCWNTWEK